MTGYYTSLHARKWQGYQTFQQVCVWSLDRYMGAYSCCAIPSDKDEALTTQIAQDLTVY